ncbi:lasso peptide biosynthesis B2 protein [Desulfofustis limnaeus]|jgi:hypothetical protein|uniref:Microcin J25-processing protein McjB C-terminal domain-containing protein n=1 Tax=Desulfofustis limnaeus TaxID=2740163 RepID=A0ABM7W4P0_9BACT|nr:lasso peptide biosynthesis B2 protein [Desulfofustis limnaeus]MDX9894067.1 lasso peptide biosynthesis B2 protein [Desulfofustis sp.]BDD85879.1 hypothetical protein DPPLL_02440 [Desulfofustis limnaeus]
MSKIVIFYNLTWVEKRLLLQAVILLGYYRLALLIVSLPRLLNVARRPQRTGSSQSQLTAAQLTRLVKAAVRLVPGTTCLSNTLASHGLFSSLGYRTKVHIGVNKDRERGFEAHAWLTLDGKIVIGNLPDLAKFRELPLLETTHVNRQEIRTQWR